MKGRSPIASSPANEEERAHERFYTVREVAAIYRVVPKSVRNWISNGEIRVWRKGRIIRISESALRVFDENR